MIDIHCHILPDIDDGPKTFDESVAMARIAAEDGIAAIVASPHLNEKLYDPAEISRRVSWLNHLLRKERIPVSIFLVNGIKLQGQIESFDQFVILLKNTVSQMVYKHAISTVVPSRPVSHHSNNTGGGSNNYHHGGSNTSAQPQPQQDGDNAE